MCVKLQVHSMCGVHFGSIVGFPILGVPPFLGFPILGFSHGPRLYVCQTPNAFTCVSGVAPLQKPNAFICVSPNAFTCVSPNAFTCVSPMRLLNLQRSSLRSLAFARFARTFSKQSKLEFLSKEHSCLNTDSCLVVDSCLNTDSCLNAD